jgi:CubicO group peptidase (beta-lactamase class C family)
VSSDVRFEKVFDQTVASRMIHECICCVENAEGDFSWEKGYGEKNLDTPFLMASITKLFTTTCIIKLIEEGKLSLEDKISKYLDANLLKEIHVLKGRDYSFEITIQHLLFQTSGLPDFYLGGEMPFFKKVIQQDFSYTFEEIINITKKQKPIFPPNTQGKAYYCDLNFDLLGKIIEIITGLNLQAAYSHYIFTALNLKNTYLAMKDEDYIPVVYYKHEQLKRDLFIKSCGASGGAVTTVHELMIFIKAFWLGKLFNKRIFERLSSFNRLQLSFYPICYAGGYMRIEAGYPFMPKIELLGHSGSTGSFAFYSPQQNLFFVGDVNQIANPALPIRLVMKLAMAQK